MVCKPFSAWSIPWLLCMLLAGCTGNTSNEPAQILPTPTMPVARFTPVAGDLNEAAGAETREQIQETVAAVPGDVEAGQRVYANRCAECHGVDRQGTAEGRALPMLDMTADEFLRFLRTGGDLGNDHLFGTTKISNPGIESLFAYLTAAAPQ